MPEQVDGFASHYLNKWRRLSESERRAMRNLRSVEFMAEAFAEYYPEEATMPRITPQQTADEVELTGQEHGVAEQLREVLRALIAAKPGKDAPKAERKGWKRQAAYLEPGVFEAEMLDQKRREAALTPKERAERKARVPADLAELEAQLTAHRDEVEAKRAAKLLAEPIDPPPATFEAMSTPEATQAAPAAQRPARRLPNLPAEPPARKRRRGPIGVSGIIYPQGVEPALYDND